MFDHLHRMAVFLAVSDAGSFRGAAERLNLSPSVVSHHVSKLEVQLGLALFYRSTRKMSLTDAGKDLLGHARRMVQAADEGVAAMQSRTAQPKGRLRVTVPSGAQHRAYSSGVVDFMRRYPGITLSVNYSDALVDLAGSEFDVAIRGSVNGLDDSSYKARLLQSEEVWLTAATAYVGSRSSPRCIDDLAGWDWIEFPPGLSLDSFLAVRMPAGSRIDLRPVATVDSMMVAETLALEGFGLLAVPRTVLEAHVRAGRLVRLLPELTLRPIKSYAIWPAKAGRNSLVRVFLDAIFEWARTANELRAVESSPAEPKT